MRGHGRTSLVLLAVAAFTAGAVIATFGGAAQDNPARGERQKRDWAEFESQFPVTDINKPEPSDPEKRAKRKARGKKYQYGGMPIERGGHITLNTEWDIELPPLPVAKSDLVVIGDVTGAEAHVSDDRTAVYSEYTIRVTEVLKNTSDAPPSVGDSLTADRQGGRVRFPNGETALQYVNGQGMPRVGGRYALFLTHADQDRGAHILTGYELRGGRVLPLDHFAAVYKEANEASFLNDLRAAVASTQ